MCEWQSQRGGQIKVYSWRSFHTIADNLSECVYNALEKLCNTNTFVFLNHDIATKPWYTCWDIELNLEFPILFWLSCGLELKPRYLYLFFFLQKIWLSFQSDWNNMLKNTVVIVLLWTTNKHWGLPISLKNSWNAQGTITLSVSVSIICLLCDTGSCLVQIVIQQLSEVINKIKWVRGNDATGLSSSLWYVINPTLIDGWTKQEHIFFLLGCAHVVIEVSAVCAFFIFSVPAGSFAVFCSHCFNPIFYILVLLSSL